MAYAPYNPAGATRTSKTGRIRLIPLEPDHFNHLWFQDYLDDFLDKNIIEDDGVISGLVISQDGSNLSINCTGGEVYIGGNKVPVATPSTFETTADGWYVAYVTSAGAVIYGYLENSTTQGAVTPPDSVIIGYVSRGDSAFIVKSFYNEVSPSDSDVYGATLHIQPKITVGPALTNDRVTDLETTFIASLSAGDQLLFINGVTFTAARIIAGQVKIWMDGPAIKVDIATFDFTLGECSGFIGITSSGGKLILDGICHALIIEGSVTVEEGTNFSGSYYLNGVLHTGRQKIEFVPQPDMVVMTAAELANYSNDPRFVKYNQTTKLFETKDNGARVPVTGDWTMIKSIETLTNDLEFPSAYNRPKIETDRHFQIPTGAGAYPFPIYVRGSGGECSFITDKTFDELIALQAGAAPTTVELKNQQYIKNRGEANRILVNNQQIYSGDRPTEIESSVQIIHPYAFPHNGYSFHGVSDAGVNDDETLLVDAWKAWGGIESLEIAPIHNPFSSILLWYKLFMPDDAGYLTRPATHFGGTGGADPSVHSRTSPNGFETLTSGNYTSAAEAIIKGVSDVNIKKFKVWARLQAAGLPSSASFTTIISKIIHNATDDNWIYLVDSETGLAVSVSATGDLTIDMGGNSGISLQLDAGQLITGAGGLLFGANATSETGAIKTGVASASGGAAVGIGEKYFVEFNSGSSISPTAAKTNDDETRVKSKQRYNYTIP